MKKFILKSCVYLIGVTMIFSMIILLMDKNKMNFNQVSNSVSLNRKIDFIKKGAFTPKILSVGSSMNLNNLNSEIIKNNLNISNKEYLNVSSWGTTVSEDYFLLKTFLLHFNKVESVFYTINFNSFQELEMNNRVFIDYKLLEKYLNNNSFFSGFSLKTSTFYRFFSDYRYVSFLSDSLFYTSLKYDSSGGVNLPTNNFRIIPERFRNFPKNELDKKKISYLDSIIDLCLKKKIDLNIILSPVRTKLIEASSNQEKNDFIKKKNDLSNLLKSKGIFFYDSNTETYPDHLFADGSHLLDEGSKKLTQDFIDLKFLHKKE